MKRKSFVAAGVLLLLLSMMGCKKSEKAEETNMEKQTKTEEKAEEKATPQGTEEAATPQITEEAATPTAAEEKAKEAEETLPYMTLIGHASVKIKTKEGIVVYIDPYYDGDYSEAADLVLVTHGHSDHCDLSLITKKDTTEILARKDLHPKADEYLSVEKSGIKITAVPAYNGNHKKDLSAGYILEFDDLSVYHAGDTSLIDEMKDLKDRNITYALYPTDGKYNMGPEEATEAANTVGAKVNISIHNYEMTEEELFKSFTPEGRLFMEYGSTITLEP